MPLVQILKLTGLTASTSEALRMIDQGAVKLNGEKVEDKSTKIMRGESVVIQVGKRKFAKAIIQ
jgi:tyrosyl-tRNA synthetase